MRTRKTTSENAPALRRQSDGSWKLIMDDYEHGFEQERLYILSQRRHLKCLAFFMNFCVLNLPL